MSLSFSLHARAAAWVAAIHSGLCALGVKGLVNGEITDDSVWWVLLFTFAVKPKATDL